MVKGTPFTLKEAQKRPMLKGHKKPIFRIYKSQQLEMEHFILLEIGASLF